MILLTNIAKKNTESIWTLYVVPKLYHNWNNVLILGQIKNDKELNCSNFFVLINEMWFTSSIKQLCCFKSTSTRYYVCPNNESLSQFWYISCISRVHITQDPLCFTMSIFQAKSFVCLMFSYSYTLCYLKKKNIEMKVWPRSSCLFFIQKWYNWNKINKSTTIHW